MRKADTELGGIQDLAEARQVKDSLADADVGHHQSAQKERPNRAHQIGRGPQIPQNQQKIQEGFDHIFPIGAHGVMQVWRDQHPQRGTKQEEHRGRKKRTSLLPELRQPCSCRLAFGRLEDMTQRDRAEADEQAKFSKVEGRIAARSKRLEVFIIGKRQRQQRNCYLQAEIRQGKGQEQKNQGKGGVMPVKEEQKRKTETHSNETNLRSGARCYVEGARTHHYLS
jgi:septum formation inhibitor MinC